MMLLVRNVWYIDEMSKYLELASRQCSRRILTLLSMEKNGLTAAGLDFALRSDS